MNYAVVSCEIALGRTGVSIDERIAELREDADQDLLDMMCPDEAHALLDLFESARAWIGVTSP